MKSSVFKPTKTFTRKAYGSFLVPKFLLLTLKESWAYQDSTSCRIISSLEISSALYIKQVAWKKPHTLHQTRRESIEIVNPSTAVLKPSLKKLKPKNIRGLSDKGNIVKSQSYKTCLVSLHCWKLNRNSKNNYHLVDKHFTFKFPYLDTCKWTA